MTATDWIQAISTVVLAIITGVYAWRTHVMSKATEKQAEASVKLAEEMKEQRYDTVRPVVDILWDPLTGARRLGEQAATPDELVSDGFSCRLLNIGLGPAVDIRSLVQPPTSEHQHHDFGTLAEGNGTESRSLLPDTEDSRLFLRAHYKDVYDREFRSSREIIGKPGDWKLGALRVELIEKGGHEE